MNYQTERMQKLHEAAMHIVETVGMKFHHPKAIEILKSNGIRCEGDVAYFTEEQLMYWVRKAPFCFTLYGGDAKYDCHFGGEEVNPAPPYGPPYIADKDGKKRKDVKNPDKALRNVDIDKVVIVEGLKYDATKKQWGGAKIYDPTKGIKVNASAEFETADKLKLRGTILGVGVTLYWHRIKK